MNQEHVFDKATALTPSENGKAWSGHIPASHENMVGPFGGAIAATLLNAVLQHPYRQGEPISLTVNFAAPIKDAPFEVTAQAVRNNKSTQHWTITMYQQEEVAVTGTALLAHRRETWSDTEAAPPEAPSPEQVPLLSTDNLPRWTHNYALRMLRGLVVAGSPEQTDSRSLLWVRDEPLRPLDWLSLTAICDTFFPRLFVRRQRIFPIGTVSMTTYFLTDGEALDRQGTGYLLAAAQANRFYNNYFDQSGTIWGRDGELLATTHQIVYFRD